MYTKPHISESLHELLEKAIRLAEGRPIRQINAALGELTGLSPEQVQAEFMQQRRHHPDVAAEARLQLEHEPGRALCLTCGQEGAVSIAAEACPGCGSHRRRIIAGEHLAFAGMSLMGPTEHHARAPRANLQADNHVEAARSPVRAAKPKSAAAPKPPTRRAPRTRAANKAGPV